MNKREAEAIARDITRHGLTVTGYRRWTGLAGNTQKWILDVQDATGHTFTVNEPGQWHERQSQYGNLAADDKPAGRPTTYGQTMLKRTVLMPPAMWGWVEATGAGNVSVGIRQAVQQAMDMERAEAEADAAAPTYNGGRW